MTPSTRLTPSSKRKSGRADSEAVFSGLKILIVEDIGMVASALKDMLEDLGCNVVALASRVPEAEEYARHESLDGVMLDIKLAGEYSFGVADILRERRIPFIILSGCEVEHLCPKLAKEPQLPKPFDRELLQRMMLSVFSGKRRAERSDDSGATSIRSTVGTPAKSPREIEAAICAGMCRFEQEYMGREPKDVEAHLFNDVLVIRIKGAVTAAEQHLVETMPPEKGRDLVKQVRAQMMEGARKQIDSMIQIITGQTIVSLHHDFSTRTGEKFVIFSLKGGQPVKK